MDRNRPAATRTLAPLVLLLSLAAAGCVARGGRLAVQEDNDVFNIGDGLDMDRDYTQGGFAALTLPAEDGPAWAGSVARALPMFDDEAPAHLGLVLGQEIYTPEDTVTENLLPRDRPYAGWAFAGLAVQVPSLDEDGERRRDRLDTLQVDLGVVGPSSRAEDAQNQTHRFLGLDRVRGWDNQLDNEPGFLATWDRRHRIVHLDLGGEMGLDALTRFRVRAGNVRVDGEGKQVVRIGWNLPRDFGPMAVDARGLRAGDGPGEPSIYLFAGGGARAVAHNIFLEGNGWQSSHEVTPKNLVGELEAGVGVEYGSFSGSFTQHWRAGEFRETNRNHRWGTILIAWTWFF